MNGYKRRTELKKDKVRNAALELFSTYGTDKTSINDIAQKAGVAPASIYNYFGSKDFFNYRWIFIYIKIIDKTLYLWISSNYFPEKFIINQYKSYKINSKSNTRNTRGRFPCDVNTLV